MGWRTVPSGQLQLKKTISTNTRLRFHWTNMNMCIRRQSMKACGLTVHPVVSVTAPCWQWGGRGFRWKVCSSCCLLGRRSPIEHRLRLTGTYAADAVFFSWQTSSSEHCAKTVCEHPPVRVSLHLHNESNTQEGETTSDQARNILQKSSMQWKECPNPNP